MKIGIVGLGLIGGSLGFDLRAAGHEVLGVSRQTATCEQAIALGAVDRASAEFELLSAAEAIFLCTPLGVMPQTAEALVPYLSPAAILTDVGSVKASVVETLEPLWHRFVGGHPMAGKETAGIAAAQAGLFANRPYVLTPTARTDSEAKATLEHLIRALQSNYYECSPAQHDRAVAWISHLPVMASASLIAACQQEPEATTLALAQALASSGFRDTSRVGGGNPALGRMMAQYNREELLRSLQIYRQSIDRCILLIEQHRWDDLERHLTETHQARPQFADKA
ncbi:prephenate/arogenate dehydrogenase [Altericista sp. CCNU0014]|uniref:prephenate/arogenate dehydrogenase n=1 Tax=Altericista sp. CCNU0014 TaxID=3082949 RepID=UPI00384EDEB7